MVKSKRGDPGKKTMQQGRVGKVVGRTRLESDRGGLNYDPRRARRKLRGKKRN